MSVADQGSPAPSLRRLPFTIRLSPHLLNRLVSQVTKPSGPGDIDGLLFGLSEEGLVVVQAERAFESSAPAGGGGDRKQQDGIFEQHIKAAQKYPQTSALQLIGWYSVRSGGGLTANDLTYHDWYFPRPHDVVLILKPEGSSGVTLEVYCRTAAGLLTEEGHRVGLVRLSNEPLESPVEVVPRPKIQDDFFMRAYELGSGDEEKPLGWKGTLAVRYRKVFGLRDPDAPETAPVKKAEAERSKAANNETPAPAVQGAPKPPLHLAAPLPAAAAIVAAPVIPIPVSVAASPIQQPPAPAVSLIHPKAPPAFARRKRAPWVTVLIVFLVTCALTFGVVSYLRNGENVPAFLQAFLPRTGLALKVEAQGDRLLLSWNRQQSAVRHARSGLLQIDDGEQQRSVKLDPRQVANGAILYHPKTDDVAFRLEVLGAEGTRMEESIRVLDAGKPVAFDLSPRDAVGGPATQQKKDASGPNASLGTPGAPADITGSLSRSTRLSQATAKNNSVAGTEAAQPVKGAEPTTSQAPEELPPAAEKQKIDNSSANDVQAIPEEAPAKPLAAAEQVAPKQTTPKPIETADSPVQRSLEQPKAEIPASINALATYVAPKPIRQVLPNVSVLPVGALSQAGLVEVLVQIDAEGKVTEAKAMAAGRKVNQALLGSAVYAARQWRFNPALLRGKAVPSQHSIVFQFAARP